MTEKNAVKITKVSVLKEAAGVQTVTLPGFGDENNTPFVARVRRVGLLSLAAGGKIPNDLLTACTELYNTGRVTKANLVTAGKVMELVAESCLVEPTFQELKEAGVELTDTQLTALYLYAQQGMQGLRPFREKPGVSGAVPDGQSVG